MKSEKNKQELESLIKKIDALKFNDKNSIDKNKSISNGKEKYLLRKEKKLQRILRGSTGK